MKRLVILLLMTGLVLAQIPDKPDRDRLEMMKMWRLTDELNLTEEQAEKFFPKYRTLMSDLEDVTKQEIELMKQIGELSEEKEVDSMKLNSLVMQARDFEKKKLDIKYKFFMETGKILSPEQQARHVVFERQFRRQLRRGIREYGRDKGMDHRRDFEPKRPRDRGRGGF